LGTLPAVRQDANEAEWVWQAVGFGERLAAMALLAAALPLLAGCALVLWLIFGRTPLIAHRRVGWQGAPLWMLKLRTMEGDRAGGGGWIERIDDGRGPELKSDSDPRVTNRFARFCRRHSLDEFPQLWHVIRGEMAVVGPRPITQDELDRHYGPHAAEILQAKPGLVGLWQISGRNRLSYAERCRLDLRLVRERSIGVYGGIVLRAVPEVFRGKNSW
jgi:lipopolysaccharide/colanic/teichoic acid biosynthesis glycosyltransferase